VFNDLIVSGLTRRLHFIPSEPPTRRPLLPPRPRRRGNHGRQRRMSLLLLSPPCLGRRRLPLPPPRPPLRLPALLPSAPRTALAAGAANHRLLRAFPAPPRPRRLAAPRGKRVAALLPRGYSGAAHRGRGPFSGALRAATARRRRHRRRGAWKSRHLLLVRHLDAPTRFFGLESWTTNAHDHPTGSPRITTRLRWAASCCQSA
jgi:hypothetical protein